MAHRSVRLLKMAAQTRFPELRSKFNDYIASYPEFRSCKSAEEKIKFLLDNDSLREKIPEESQYKKCLEKSFHFKEEGNIYFGKKDYQNALVSYTKSIYFAPLCKRHNILPVNYANRSAVLYEFSEYVKCLDDIDRSLHHNYPEELRYKIYLRKALCLKKLSQHESASENFLLAEQYLNKSNLNEVRKQQINQLITTSCNVNYEKTDYLKSENSVSLPELYKGQNRELESGSACLAVTRNSQQGRHIIVTEDIPAGSTLFIEKPFASALLPTYYGTHCFLCCRQILSPIPCLHCAQVGYCNERCRDESWEIYHQFECLKLDYLNEIGIMYLSLRTLLSANIEKTLTNKSKLQIIQNNDMPGTDQAGNFKHSYYAICHLQSHLEDLSDEEVGNFVLYACHTMWFLEDQIKSIKSKLIDILTKEAKNFLTYLLLQHGLQIICNAYAITELQITEIRHNVCSQEPNRVGVALYPNASLLNHSCKPNILSSFIGDKLIVRCTQAIKKGEQVLNCYGPHYQKTSRDERQNGLKKQYRFECCCEACENENEGLDSFKCDSCDGRVELKAGKSTVGCCTDCKKTQDCCLQIKKSLEADTLYEEAEKLIEKNDYKNALKKIKKCLDVRKRVLYKRHEAIDKTHDELARCLTLNGDFIEAMKYLKLSIEAVKQRYGPESVEYGTELIKLSDFQVKFIMDTQVEHIKQENFRHQLQDLFNTCDEGVEILSKAFGEWYPYVKNLKEKKQHFANIFQIDVGKP